MPSGIPNHYGLPDFMRAISCKFCGLLPAKAYICGKS